LVGQNHVLRPCTRRQANSPQSQPKIHQPPAKTPQSSYSERSETMYVSRLTFHTTPGKTHEVEQELLKLMAMVSRAGGVQPRVLRSHLASPGAPDVVFEQEVADLETLTPQITQVTEREDFQKWSSHMSGLLTQSPKREVYLIVEIGRAHV